MSRGGFFWDAPAAAGRSGRLDDGGWWCFGDFLDVRSERQGKRAGLVEREGSEYQAMHATKELRSNTAMNSSPLLAFSYSGRSSEGGRIIIVMRGEG
jgi:hypothetical protein